MFDVILIAGLIYIVFLLKIASASNVGLIEDSDWGSNLTGVRFSATAFGDIDNDNDNDLALIGCLPGAGANKCTKGTITKIYINNGTALTESSQWQRNLTDLGWGSTSFGDIDNDGDLDLALSGCTNASDDAADCNGDIISKIYINNGTSLIENMGWQNNLTAVFDSSMAFGDIDNDGDLDLVLNGKSPSLITKVYINNGTSFIENSTWQSELTAINEGQIALGDVDNDGDLDLALSGDIGTPADFTSFYINNGTAFAESTQWNDNLVAMDRSSFIFGDIDNDGDLDLFLCGHTNADKCHLYKNNGSTFLLNQTQGGAGGCLPGIYRSSIAFGDYDNDGDLDLAAIGHEYGRARVCENNEINNYYFQNDALAHANISDDFFEGALTWSDIDNDGDLDLLIAAFDAASTSVSKIYINNNTTPNTQPLPPSTNFSSNYSISNAILNLSWENGSDAETNTLGLYYNLMVGNVTNNHTIVSGVYGGSSGGGGGAGGGASGYFGNMMQRKSISLNVNLSNGTYYWYVQTIDTGLAKSNWSERQTFTVGTDITSPVLSSISSSVTSSSATITWTTDESANSSVYYGTTNATTSSSGSSSLVTSHSVSLSGLSASTFYYYNVSSCDNSNNCNTSSQYNFTTSSAPADGGTTSGGRGGGGATPSKNITTTPKKFDIDFSKTINGSFEVKQGDIKTFSFNGETEHTITILTLTTNSVTLLITSNPITIQIKLGETKQIDINKDSINDFEIKLVSIINGMASFSLKKLAGADIVGEEELEEAVRKEALFDVKVHILDKFKEVFPGEEVSAKIEVFNINNIGQVDVVVNYYITTKGNQTKLAEGFDTLAVEAVTSFVRTLVIPDNLKPGIYYFNVDVIYKNFTTSGNAEFEVKSTKLRFIEERWKEIIIVAIGIAALIAIAVFFYLRMIKKREEKLEKKEARLEGEIKKLRGRK